MPGSWRKVNVRYMSLRRLWTQRCVLGLEKLARCVLKECLLANWWVIKDARKTPFRSRCNCFTIMIIIFGVLFVCVFYMQKSCVADAIFKPLLMILFQFPSPVVHDLVLKTVYSPCRNVGNCCVLQGLSTVCRGAGKEWEEGRDRGYGDKRYQESNITLFF